MSIHRRLREAERAVGEHSQPSLDTILRHAKAVHAWLDQEGLTATEAVAASRTGPPGLCVNVSMLAEAEAKALAYRRRRTKEGS